MKKEKAFRGDIFIANLNPVKGSEQGGKRPVVIIQNDKGNSHSPTVIVAPITSRHYKKKLQPTHVLLDSPVLEKKSQVLVEQIKTIDKSRLISKIGQVSKEKMQEIDVALIISLALADKGDAS